MGTAGPSNEPLRPIHLSVAGYRRVRRDARLDKARSAYLLIVRGPDGRLRSERFADPAAYRARLASLTIAEHSENSSISIEEIAGFLDP